MFTQLLAKRQVLYFLIAFTKSFSSALCLSFRLFYFKVSFSYRYMASGIFFFLESELSSFNKFVSRVLFYSWLLCGVTDLKIDNILHHLPFCPPSRSPRGTTLHSFSRACFLNYVLINLPSWLRPLLPLFETASGRRCLREHQGMGMGRRELKRYPVNWITPTSSRSQTV